MNSLDKAFNIGASIVVLAMVAVVIKSPHTAGQIKAVGSVFTGSLAQAQRG